MPPRKRVRAPAIKLSPVKEQYEAPTQSNAKENQPAESVPSGTSASQTSTQAKQRYAHSNIRENVIESFRNTFQGRGNIVDCTTHSLRQLLACYTRAKKVRSGKAKEAFFNELDIRLCMMIESKTVIEARIRVLRMVSRFCLTILNDANDSSILDFLLDEFIATWSKSNEIDCRMFIAYLIGFIFEAALVTNNRTQSLSLDVTYSRKLYSYLLTFLRDKPIVRVAAIKSVSVIQKIDVPNDFEEAVQFMPKELILRSFRDVAWECRLAAVEEFVANGEGQIRQLAQLALSDKSTKVRCIALDKFGKLKLRDSDSATKLELLYTCLNDHEYIVRESVRKFVIEKWLLKLSEGYQTIRKKKLGIGRDEDTEIIEVDHAGEKVEFESKEVKTIVGYIYAASVILGFFDATAPVDTMQQVRVIMSAVFDIARHLYNVHLEPIEYFAEAIVEDTPDDAIEIFHRRNCFTVLETNDCDMETRLFFIYFWRLLVDYMVDRSKSSVDAMAAVERMVPKLVRMVEMVDMTIKQLKEIEIGMERNEEEFREESRELFPIRQSYILQHLLVIIRYTDKDPTGLKHYKKLLEDMLYNIRNSKGLIDIIISDLMTNFYLEDPFSMINDITAGFSDMMNRAICGDQTLRDETVFIGTAAPRRATEEDREVLEAIAAYELSVINAMLKTGEFKTIDPIVKTKYHNLIVKKLASDNLDERLMAIECVGLVGIIDLSLVESELGLLFKTYELDQEEAKTVFIISLVDLCVTHGTDVVEETILRNIPDRKKNSQTVIGLLCESVMECSSEQERIIKACEGLGKLLLNETVDPKDLKWQKAIIALLSRMNYKSNGKFTSKVRSIITALLKFFASLSIKNQQLIVKSFEPFFKEWDTNPTLIAKAGCTQHIYQRLCRSAALFAIITRHSLLINKVNSPPAHLDLVSDAFNELLSNQESSSSNYYCEVLQWIELETIDYNDLGNFYQHIDDLIILYEGDTKGRSGEIKKFKRRLMKALGISDRDNQRALDEEIGIKLEVPDEVEQPLPTKKITSPKSVTKSAIKNRDVEGEIRQLVESPIREITSATKKPRPPVESRAHLKRAARRLQ